MIDRHQDQAFPLCYWYFIFPVLLRSLPPPSPNQLPLAKTLYAQDFSFEVKNDNRVESA
jgi:hypothetical protein